MNRSPSWVIITAAVSSAVSIVGTGGSIREAPDGRRLVTAATMWAMSPWRRPHL